MEVSNTELIKKKFASVMPILFHIEEHLVVVLRIQQILFFYKRGMVTIMADFNLDIAKWRCGNESKDFKNKMGKGITELTNEFGYSCCIGQFAKQTGIDSAQLLNRATPQVVRECMIGFELPELFNSMFLIYEDNSELATELMEINDNDRTSVKYKIQHIKNKLEEHGHTLTIKNDYLIP